MSAGATWDDAGRSRQSQPRPSGNESRSNRGPMTASRRRRDREVPANRAQGPCLTMIAALPRAFSDFVRAFSAFPMFSPYIGAQPAISRTFSILGDILGDDYASQLAFSWVCSILGGNYAAQDEEIYPYRYYVRRKRSNSSAFATSSRNHHNLKCEKEPISASCAPPSTPEAPAEDPRKPPIATKDSKNASPPSPGPVEGPYPLALRIRVPARRAARCGKTGTSISERTAAEFALCMPSHKANPAAINHERSHGA